LHPAAATVADWPWTWLRVAFYVKQVRNVHERAALDADKKTALPPRRLWFESDELDDWFDARREARKERDKPMKRGRR